MKLTRLIVALAICVSAATQRAHGQVAQQLLHFLVVGQFGTNIIGADTNTAGATDEVLRIGGVFINTPNVVKAIALDLDGPAWTNWRGSSLVLETDFTTGAQGIFLRSGKVQTNVSSFFGDSFSNNFTTDLGIDLGFTNQTFLSNGVQTMITNTAFKGSFTTVGINPTVTNRIQSASLFAASLSTANMKFNVLAFGIGTGTNFAAQYKGAAYSRWVNTFSATGVGNFAINLGSNIFFGPNLYETTNFVSGPAHGTISCDPPVFSPLTGP